MNVKALGVVLSLLTVGVFTVRRPSSGQPAPAPTPGSAPAGDLEANWGTTPIALRPLLLRMEEVLQAPGAARFFAVVARAESRFVVNAHNTDKGVALSRRAYDNAPASYPKLAYAGAAREFGSGGLFGQLAPYFLWTGAAEIKAKAPLLGKPPAAMFDPRLAAFGAVVNLHRLLTLYRVDDLLDARVGWASIDLLGKRRGSDDYLAVRQRFRNNAEALGVDLAQLPPKLQPGKWPGVLQAFAALTG